MLAHDTERRTQTSHLRSSSRGLADGAIARLIEALRCEASMILERSIHDILSAWHRVRTMSKGSTPKIPTVRTSR